MCCVLFTIMSGKRNQTFVTMEQRIKALKCLDRGESVQLICRDFNVGSYDFASRKVMGRTPFSGGPVELGIRKKLTENLNPSHLEIINESHNHSTPPEAETHFKVVIVAEKFNEMPLIKRHRTVNELLKDELATIVHALSIEAKTPEQWSKSPEFTASPKCLGGFGK